MCCDNRFMFFIRVRTGSLIFAWIGAVLSGLGSLACFIANMIFTILLIFGKIYFQGGVTTYVFTAHLLVFFSTGFIASVLLLVGIIQRKPILIKGYIIYGMVVTVLYILIIITLECTLDVEMVARIFEILGCLIYCSILYLHYLTFKDTVDSSNTNGYVVPPEEG